MASQRTISVCLLYLISTVYCGDITVGHSPSTLRFGFASTVRQSIVDDIITAALGYTPKESSPWNGLTITDPFSLPVAAVVVGLHGGGASIRQEGTTYSMKEDTTMKDVYDGVKIIVGSRAQRETLLKYINVDDELAENGPIPVTKLLNITVEPDATFLREMATFIKVAMTIDEITTTTHGGQDVIFMELNSFAPLVKVYGLNSPKVNEAIEVVRNYLARVTDMMKRVYDDQVLVITATVDKLQKISRPSRSILQAPDPDPTADLNLATEYSTDYPAVFNIVLWVSLILILFIAFAAISMATMDPGQDSIIYRMTNPRMKKDN